MNAYPLDMAKTDVSYGEKLRVDNNTCGFVLDHTNVFKILNVVTQD
jgi:hypothetical protein